MADDDEVDKLHQTLHYVIKVLLRDIVCTTHSTKRMESEFQFQVVVHCGEKKALESKFVLPSIFSSVMPVESKFCITLVNYSKEEHLVSVERVDDDTFEIKGLEWTDFVKRYPYGDISKICFKFIEQSVFEVQFYCEADLEYRWRVGSGESAVKSQLVLATEDCLKKVMLYECLVFKLNANNEHTWQTIAVIRGRKANGTAEVVYRSVRFGNIIYQNAVGFEGISWTKFCEENDVHVGNLLKVTDNADSTFSVDVFDSEGVLQGVVVSGSNNSFSECGDVDSSVIVTNGSLNM